MNQFILTLCTFFSCILLVRGAVGVAPVGGSSSASAWPNTVNGIPTSQFAPPYTYSDSTCVYTNINTVLTTVGNNDLFTIPTGYKAISQTCYYKSTTNTTTVIFNLNVSGTYYPVTTKGSALTNGFATTVYNPVMNAGETASVNIAGDRIVVCLNFVMIPDTVPIYRKQLYSLASGTNILYQVPANTHSFVGLRKNLATSTQAIYVNASGGTRTVTWFYAPSGITYGTDSFYNSGTVNDGSISSKAFGELLNPGDFLGVISDATTGIQWVFMNVIEF